MSRARPLVTLHFAQSLDGRIGFGPGRERALLSGEEGMLSAHRARAGNDAVLVGLGTLLDDDPLLTARSSCTRQPLRVVLDSRLRLPLTARLLEPNAAAGGVLVFGSSEGATHERKQALEARGAAVHLTSSGPQARVVLPEVLDELAERGVERLLVEGGACVITSFLQARLVSSVEIELAPWLLGAPATPAVHELGVAELGRALKLVNLQSEPLGQGLLLRADIEYPGRERA